MLENDINKMNNYHTQMSKPEQTSAKQPQMMPQSMTDMPPNDTTYQHNYMNPMNYPQAQMSQNYPPKTPIQRPMPGPLRSHNPSDGEIELSDTAPLNVPAGVPDSTVESVPACAKPMNVQPMNVQPMNSPYPDSHSPHPRSHRMPPDMPNQTTNIIPSDSSGSSLFPLNLTLEYIVIPIFLVIVFIFLVHPKTTNLFIKYVPPMRQFKGFIVRGIILAVLYVAFRGILKVTGLLGPKN